MHPENDAVLAEKRRLLHRQRAVATGLLIVMAAIFLGTQAVAEPTTALLLLRAGSEAALVGGLADWFAVTALFRRPLGLPIPHTALIPRKKDELAAGLASFLERNFLTPDVILSRLRGFDVVGAAARWLADPVNAKRLAQRSTALVPFLLSSLRDRQLRRFVRRALRARLGSVEVAPLLGRVLRVLTAHGHHRLLLEHGAAALRRFLQENEPLIYAQVEARSRWWIPRRLDRRIAQSLIAGILDLLEDLGETGNPVRERFEAAVTELVDRLEHDAELRAAVERLWQQILSDPVVQDYLGSVWDEARRALLEDAARPEPKLAGLVAGALSSLAQGVVADAAVRARITARFESFVVQVVLPWRREIGALIVGVVRSWDTRTLTDRIELEVGRDLQFVRINGTVVGALVGCLLFLLVRLLDAAG